MSEGKIPVRGELPVRYEVNNTYEQVRIRKYQNTLVIAGLGIMLFTAWTAVRTIGDLILKKPQILEFMTIIQDGEQEVFSDALVYYVYCAFTLIFLLIGIFFRVIIGRAAIAEGRGRRVGRIYLFLTFILIIFGILSASNEAFTFIMRSESEMRIEDVSLVSVFIEFTSLFMLLDLFVSSLKLRHMRNQAGMRGQ